LIVGGGVIWLLMSALEVTSSDISTKLFFNKISFVGHIIIIPTTWLILSMLISGYERYVRRKTIIALSIVPLITLLLIFTNEYHGLIWNSVRLDAADQILPLNISYGLGYWLLVVGYSYAVLLVGSILFVWRIVFSRRLYRLQALPLMLVLFVPWALDVIYQYNRNLFGYVEPTAVTLTVAVAILMWRLIYLPALDVVPIAHEMIIDSMNDAVIVLDWERRIVDLNPSAQALLGHTLQEVVGRPVEKVWTEWPRLRKVLDAETEGTKEVSFGSGDKQRVYELQSTALERLGRKDALNMLIILRDITERNRTIVETAAMVGHDLRNPLQGIMGAAYALKTHEGNLSEKGKEMLHVIEDAIERSDKIINDLLAYSRELQLDLSTSNAKSLIDQSLASMKIPKNINIVNHAKEQPTVEVDVEKMKRVCLNLMKNAVDAMPNGGTLTITNTESDGNLRVSFADTGEGISEEILAKIWSPLFTTKARGMGYGLAIVKRFMEAHGGSVSVETNPGKGSTFTIRIPIDRTAKTSMEAQTEEITAT
jgi:PAS domain S-box-containing protein